MAATNLLESPGLFWVGTVPLGPNSAHGESWFCLGECVVAKDMELTSFFYTPESISAPPQPRDMVLPLQHLTLERAVGEIER